MNLKIDDSIIAKIYGKCPEQNFKYAATKM